MKLLNFIRHKSPFLAAVIIAILTAAPQVASAAKNVIIMISDGAGYNTFLATSMYRGKVGKETYDGTHWVRVSCSTYPLNRSVVPTNDEKQDPHVVYDPAKAWSTQPEGEGSDALGTVGYQFLLNTWTDSAAAATVMATGIKTYNNSINYSNQGKPLTGMTLAEIAKVSGRSVGQITTVPWSHATPAGFGGAHNISRNDYEGIAREMLNAPYLDVLMGAGHPDFSDDGTRQKPTPIDYQYVGGKETWELLKTGRHPAGWKLLESKEDFNQLAKDRCPPTKIVGVVQTASTTQQKRSMGLPPSPGVKLVRQPYREPFNKNVPSLATMTEGALNSLSQNPSGFYLMIEGGAVDWCNHANQSHRLIEEQIDFLNAIDEVVLWVEAHGGWKENLVIITADHECGMLWGTKGDTAPFDPLVDNGPGQLPGMKHFSNGHSNQLVPLYARGAGSNDFLKQIMGKDLMAAKVWNVSGDYVDDVSVFKVANTALKAKPKTAKEKKPSSRTRQPVTTR